LRVFIIAAFPIIEVSHDISIIVITVTVFVFLIQYQKSSVEGEKDTELRIADPYTEKILDASSDSYIPESTYPSSQRIYPTKGAGVVSTFKIQKDSYSWAHDNFKIADKNNLMIYELLLRDFTETGDLQGAIQKLDYLRFTKSRTNGLSWLKSWNTLKA